MRSFLTRLRDDPFLPIWPATALLFVVSPFLARGSLDSSAILGMLPFAAILAIAGIGQTLVVQQRGLDLSIPGMISLSTVLITVVPDGDDSKLPLAIGLVIVACVVAGLISGLAVTRFGITPLIATLGVNALLVGAVLQITSGTSTAIASPALDAFGFGKTLGLPNAVWVAVAAVLVVAAAVRSTTFGRRFVAAGADPAAANVAGVSVRRYQLGTYVASALAGGLAGILLAGFVGTPPAMAGDAYLLPTIAAVVLGGTSLAGGTGSVIATAVGALFLVQLQSVMRGMGAPASLQLIIQGSIIAIGMALRTVDRRHIYGRRGPGARMAGPPTGSAPGTPVRAEGG